MNTADILHNLRSNGGFNNWKRLTKKEIEEWVLNSFPCSKYVAKKVAEYIV